MIHRSIYGEPMREDNGAANCVEYGQFNVPIDRGWPTYTAEFGYAEYVFGSAIGYLRGSDPVKYPVTIGIVSPVSLMIMGY